MLGNKLQIYLLTHLKCFKSKQFLLNLQNHSPNENYERKIFHLQYFHSQLKVNTKLVEKQFMLSFSEKPRYIIHVIFNCSFDHMYL